MRAAPSTALKRGKVERASSAPKRSSSRYAAHAAASPASGRVIDVLTLEGAIQPITAEIFKKAIDAPHGMILVTGPTGSGKTTTLYSVLQELNNPQYNIVTAAGREAVLLKEAYQLLGRILDVADTFGGGTFLGGEFFLQVPRQRPVEMCPANLKLGL